MSEGLSNNLGSVVIVAYLAVVALAGLLGLITLAILHKHAEKKSVATGVSVVFVILFTLIFLASLGPVSRL